MPPFVKVVHQNGRDNGAAARWSSTEVNDLEDRIETAIGTGTAGGPELVNQGTITVSTTLDMAAHQDVIWVVTLGATNLKLEISNWSTGKSVTLIVKQDATGGRVLQSLPTAKWDGGTIPTGSTAANAIDIRSFFRGLSETFGFESGTGMA
jgi:hypothetical protein